MAKRIIITASGGGHTGYALALAQRLRGRIEIVFVIPEGDRWTKEKVEKYGRVVQVKKARGPRDPLFKAIPGLVKAFAQSLFKIPGNFQTIVCTGSNHSVPPGYAAKFKGMKVVSIESSVRFTSPSRSIKTLSKISDLLALQWPEQKEFFPQGVVVGPLYELPEYKPKNEGYVLVTGGTYGHRLLFEAVDKLEVEKVVLQTGRIDPRPFRERHPGWTVFDFDPDFGKWLAGASVVVTHFGKTAIDAALTYRKPVVLVPNPEWRLTASLEDAKILARKLNAVLVEEISPSKIKEAIKEAIFREPPTHPDGAAKLVDLILKLNK